jgi:hypothetical protein
MGNFKKHGFGGPYWILNLELLISCHSVDGSIRVRRDLAAWPAGGLAEMGICYWTHQSTCLAIFRLLSSPVGPGPGKLPIHLFMDSRGVEFLGEAENWVTTTGPDEPGQRANL